MLKDAEVEELQRRERSEQIQGFRLLRDTVLEHRDQEARSRRALTQQQLEMYDGMQVSVGHTRRAPGLKCMTKSRCKASVTEKGFRNYGRHGFASPRVVTCHMLLLLLLHD